MRKDSQSRLYFAYGSNMDAHQMAKRCAGARFKSLVILDGFRFMINSRGVATAVAVAGASVWGGVWEITARDEANLDRCEGVALGIYRKERVQVRLASGKGIEALTYIAADSRPGSPRPGYLEKILAAATVHGFPPVYLAELASWKNGEGRNGVS